MLPKSSPRGVEPGLVLALLLLLLLLLLLPAPDIGTRARAATAACADLLNRFNWMRICRTLRREARTVSSSSSSTDGDAPAFVAHLLEKPSSHAAIAQTIVLNLAALQLCYNWCRAPVLW
jgi:hypothetical protein